MSNGVPGVQICRTTSRRPTSRCGASATTCYDRLLRIDRRVRQLPQAHRPRTPRPRRTRPRPISSAICCRWSTTSSARWRRRLTATRARPPSTCRSGVELIHRQLLDMLRRRGVEPFDALGQDLRSGRGTKRVGDEPADGRPRRRNHRRDAPRIPDRDASCCAGAWSGWPRRDAVAITTKSSASRATPAIRTSRARTASSRSSTIPTGTPATPTPRNASRKRPRPTPCSATRRSARATTASAMPACRRARGAGPGLQPRHLRGLLRHPRRLLRLRRRRRRRGGPARGADLRFDLEISFEESYAGTETTIQIPREETCETCKGIGRGARARRRETCAQCRGTRPAALSAGLPRRRPAVRPVRRNGQDRSQALPRLPRHGTDDARSARHGRRFPPASPTVSGCVCTAKASTARPAARPATSTSSSTSAARGLPPRGRRPLRRSARAVSPRWRWAASFKVDGPAGPLDVDVSAGTASGSLITFRGKGMPSVTRTRARRVPRSRRRRRAARSSARNRRSSSSSSATRWPSTRSSRADRRGRRQAVLREGQGSVRVVGCVALPGAGRFLAEPHLMTT